MDIVEQFEVNVRVKVKLVFLIILQGAICKCFSTNNQVEHCLRIAGLLICVFTVAVFL